MAPLPRSIDAIPITAVQVKDSARKAMSDMIGRLPTQFPGAFDVLPVPAAGGAAEGEPGQGQGANILRLRNQTKGRDFTTLNAPSAGDELLITPEGMVVIRVAFEQLPIADRQAYFQRPEVLQTVMSFARGTVHTRPFDIARDRHHQPIDFPPKGGSGNKLRIGMLEVHPQDEQLIDAINVAMMDESQIAESNSAQLAAMQKAYAELSTNLFPSVKVDAK